MFHHLILLSSVLVLSNSWVVDISDNKVAKKLTTNVTLKCHYDQNDNQAVKLTTVTRIRILKLGYNKWNTVAKMSNVYPAATNLYDAVVTGKVDGLKNSFLQIQFHLASEETIGQFRCEVDGYDVNDNIEAVNTQAVNVDERGVTYEDILDIIYGLQKAEEHDFSDSQARVKVLEETLKSLKENDKNNAKVLPDLHLRIESLNTNFKRVMGDLNKQQKATEADIQAIKDANKVKAWPEGVYSMLMPQSGCPNSETFSWTTSSVQIATKAGSGNQDQSSSQLNLKQPVFSNNTKGNHFTTMTSCSKVNNAAGPAWPKGKYCLQSYDSSLKCPVNFQYGKMTFDRYNVPGGAIDKIVNFANKVTTNDLTTLGYCCRSDGDESTPISLPSDHEFYLYRFYGTCQEVEGMDVANEWLSLDTGARDTYGNTYHPDGHLHPMRIEICRYTPK